MLNRSLTANNPASILAGDGILAEETVPRRLFQTSDGVALSIMEAPSATQGALTIAFIPGWCMPASLWRRQLRRLGGQYRVLALDPRGQGESEAPSYGFTAERRAADLQEFLEPLSNVLLIGWSLGALEALQYIHMFGDGKIAGLVIVDSSVGEYPPPPPGGNFLNALRQDRDKALDEFIRAIFAKPRPEEEIDVLLRGARRISIENSISLLSYPFEREHWKRIVHAFAKPLLYVATPQYEGQAHSLMKNRPGTQIEIFRQAGHALFVDEPERFNDLIAGFAARLGSDP